MTRARAWLLGLFPLLLVITAHAAGPRFWTVSTATDFLDGRSDGVFVSLQGVVSAGPALTSRLSSSPAQVWSLIQGGDDTLWVGTGGDGRVLRLRPGQPEEVIFEPEESNVFALARAGARVYAAGSPDGQVYVIDSDGTSAPFFDPEEQYIWALAVDAQDRLWVGTGTPAAIYRVDPDGTSTEIHRPAADHVVALVPDASGRMLAGTESPGRLYRFDGDSPFVLLDSGLTELRAIAVGSDGRIFAAAVERGDSSPSDGETTSVAVTIAEPPTGESESSSSARQSAVYRIDPDGGWETIWETPDVVYDLASEGDGSVLAATGPAGRLYRISGDRDVMLFTGVDARQITRFASGQTPGRPAAFATANPGRVVTIGSGTQPSATYLSDVRDTNSVSAWGLVRWEAQGAVELFTRSGNTAEPDDSWSDWAGPYTAAAGVNVSSPAARFLQWKAELTQPETGPSATLNAVTVAYLPRNTRPVVSGITVHPPGVVFQRPFTSDDSAIAGLDDAVAEARRPPGGSGPPDASPGRRMFQKGLQTLQWEASDADDDRLSYALEYRRDGENTWHTLRDGLLGRIFVWDTTAMADGRYLVRVVASDEATNAADRALTGDRTSDPVMIDNTPPRVTIEPAAGSAQTVRVRVQDALTPIEQVEFSVRGGPWQLVYPADGLADSPDEQYEIQLAEPGDRNELVVRAMDRLRNVTSQAAGEQQR